jgi:hypothetical protein
MIVYKQWKRPYFKYSINNYEYEGWFLFGFLPLYVRRIGMKTPRS